MKTTVNFSIINSLQQLYGLITTVSKGALGTKTTTTTTRRRLQLRNSYSSSLQSSRYTILICIFVLLFVLFDCVESIPFVSTGEQQQQQKQQKTMVDSTKTYYDILQIQSTATLMDIKKAYRKLALLYHPDRNIGSETKDEKELLFRKVAEAYEVLSDDTKRAEYDQLLKYGGTSGSDYTTTMNNNNYYNNNNHHDMFHHNFHHRDPFEQFNDLFHNDAFFNDAFRDMDTVFKETFEKHNNQQRQQQQQQQQNPKQAQTVPKHDNTGWSLGGIAMKLLKACGVDFHITTSSYDGTSHTAKSYTNTNNHRQYHHTGTIPSSTYSKKSTQTIIQNGQRITIQSMEKDGNRIEEKYINNQLVERKINGLATELLTDSANEL